MKHNAKTDMIGLKFGSLLVTDNAEKQDAKKLSWKCLCDCGKEHVAVGTELRRGKVKSCGCVSREKSKERMTTHGKSTSKAYSSWRSMMKRCYQESHTGFKDYGGKGITVCDSWHIFENFYSDMGDPKEGMTIDRINNNGNYSPDNCKWSTKTEQNENRKVTKWLEMNGIKQTQAKWAAQLGMYPSSLARRLTTMSVEEALTTPKKGMA